MRVVGEGGSGGGGVFVFVCVFGDYIYYFGIVMFTISILCMGRRECIIFELLYSLCVMCYAFLYVYTFICV